MIGRDIFKIWAPFDANWTRWIRPVPFVSIDENLNVLDVSDFSIPNIHYIDNLDTNVAVIVDLPGNESIKEGLGICKKFKFRPIPLYNGTNEQENALSAVDNHSINLGLIKGAKIVQELEIGKDANPVFLLDSNRMNRYKMNPSVFDNSWDIYHQDLPSADYFLKYGINKIIVIGEVDIQKDLKKILYKFQLKGIKIFFTEGYDEIKEINITKRALKYK